MGAVRRRSEGVQHDPVAPPGHRRDRGFGLAAAAAGAQPSSPEGGDTRFTFHRADDGYLRLDGRSGQVSMCQRRTTGWQCQLVPDERTALEAEISRLQSDNAALKKELLSRNLPLPDGMRPDQPGVPNPRSSGRSCRTTPSSTGSWASWRRSGAAWSR